MTHMTPTAPNLLFVALLLMPFNWQPQAAAGEATEPGVYAARRVVKLYGAGGIRGLEAYQTGILVSPTGHIVTALSTALDSEAIDCVLDDGRRYPARLLGADLTRELAVLEIDGENLPCFSLSTTAPRAAVGSRVLALSNLFGVAVGDERVSLQHGVIAACVPLRARRGAHEAAYRGDVYILDCTTNNPGSPGGCLTDWQGRLLGMLGKELRAEPSGIWLSYALPADELARGYEQAARRTECHCR
jgi:S1-C subfamily serine protease